MVNIRPVQQEFAHGLATSVRAEFFPALCLDPRLANSAACPEALRFRYYGLMCQSCPLLLASLLRSSAGLCSLDFPLLVVRTFPALSLRILHGCLDPYPGGLGGALTRFFPPSFGLPPFSTRSAPAFSREAISTRGTISGLQSFRYVQASIFACHPGRSYRYDDQLSYGSRDVYFRAPQGLLPHLTSDMLAVRIG